MPKIPVWKTIVGSYRFAGTRYLSLLGILWLPILIYLVVTYFITKGAAEQLLSAPPLGGTAQPSYNHIRSFGYLTQLCNLVFFAVASVALANAALGKTSNPRLAYLRFGMQEFRALVSFILVMLFVYAIILVTGIAGGVVIAAFAIPFLHGSTTSAEADPALLELLFALAIAALSIASIPAVFIAVRLGFFIAPAATFENRFGLLRSWELTRGNFWRCLAILIATVVPGVLLTIALFYGLYGRAFPDALLHIATAPRILAAMQVAALQKMVTFGPYLWPASLFLAPFTVGVLLSAGPIAYREVGADVRSLNVVPQHRELNTGTDPS